MQPLNEDTVSPNWYVYLVENKLGHLYAGITTDPKRRIRQHRGDISGGARALKGKAPIVFRLVWQVTNQRHALQTEHWLKSLSKQQKLAMINRQTAPPNGIFDISHRFV